MIFDVVGDLFADGRQLKQLALDDRIIGLLGTLPVHGRLIPEIVRPIHPGRIPAAVPRVIGLFSVSAGPRPRKSRPIPESVVKVDRDGAKSGSADRRRRVEASKVRLRFGLLSGEPVSIPRQLPPSPMLLLPGGIKHALDVTV